LTPTEAFFCFAFVGRTMKLVFLLLLLLACAASAALGQTAPNFGSAATYTVAAPAITIDNAVDVVGSAAYTTLTENTGQLTTSGVKSADYAAIAADVAAAATFLSTQTVTSATLEQFSENILVSGVHSPAVVDEFALYATTTFSGSGVFIMKFPQALTITANLDFKFTNGAVPANVFWYSPSSITVSHFNLPGTIVADTIIVNGVHVDRVYATTSMQFSDMGRHYVDGSIASINTLALPNFGPAATYEIAASVIDVLASSVNVVGDVLYDILNLDGNTFTVSGSSSTTTAFIMGVLIDTFDNMNFYQPSGVTFLSTSGEQTITTGTYTWPNQVTCMTPDKLTFSGPGTFIITCTGEITIQLASTFQFRNGASASNVIWFAPFSIVAAPSYTPGTVFSKSVIVGYDAHVDRVYVLNSLRFEAGGSAVIQVSGLPAIIDPLSAPNWSTAEPFTLLGALFDMGTTGNPIMFSGSVAYDTLNDNLARLQPSGSSTTPLPTGLSAHLAAVYEDLQSRLVTETIDLTVPTNKIISPGVYILQYAQTTPWTTTLTLSGNGNYIFLLVEQPLYVDQTVLKFTNNALPEKVVWVGRPDRVAIASALAVVPGTIFAPHVDISAGSVDRAFAISEMRVYASSLVVNGLSVTPVVPSGPGPHDCLAIHGTDFDACNLDELCHVDQIGPDAVCANGPAVSKDALFYDMPVKVVSVTTGTAPHVFEVEVRVPIFQAYETSGYFQFLVGTASNTFDMSTVVPSNTCNSIATQLTANAWPQSYSELRDQPECGWANGDTAVANAALRLEREALKVWVNANRVFPWQAPTNGGPAYDATKAACWRDILGDMNAAKVASDNVAMTAGLISDVSIPDDPNFIQYTLHVNADTVWGACHPAYPGMTYTSADIGTDHESIKYMIPITAVQRTSHRQQITTSIYTTLQVVTAANVTVSTTIYQPVTLNELGIIIESLQVVDAGPLNPDTSLASAHRLEMTYLLTVEKPDDVNVLSLGPRAVNDDIVLTIPGQPTNCYGDEFKNKPVSFEPILPCVVDGGGKTQCTFRIRLVSEARTDLYDGNSFATCGGTIGAAQSPLDKLHIFGIKLQLCTAEGCSYVSPDPIRVISSFFVPIYPVRSVTQNEQIYALLLETAETPIAPLSAALSDYGARRFITNTDTINVAIVTRPALWERYSVSVLPAGNAIQLFAAATGVLLNAETGWTLVADQTALATDMRYSPKWRVATGSVESPIPGYPGCDAVGMGCDGFSFDASKIMARTVGPQVKFVARANIAMQVYNPVSRRLLSTIDIPKTLGAWSSTITQRQADVHVQAPAAGAAGLRGERRRRKAVPDAQTSLTNAPFTGSVGSAFVFTRSLATVNGTNSTGTDGPITAVADAADDSNDDVIIIVAGVLGGLGAILAVALVVFCCKRRKRDADAGAVTPEGAVNDTKETDKLVIDKSKSASEQTYTPAAPTGRPGCDSRLISFKSNKPIAFGFQS